MNAEKQSLMAMLVSMALCIGALEVGLRVLTVGGFRLINPSFYGDQNWFEFHPELEYTLRREHERVVVFMADDCSDRAIDIATNNLGVRDPQGTWEHANRPLVFVGDSFTEGYHVIESITFAGLVRDRLGGVPEVWNFGVHNYDTANYRRM